MPKELFASARASRAHQGKRGWTLIGSIAVHGALLFALIAVSIGSALNGPQVVRGLTQYIITAAPPEPPPPPASTAPAHSTPTVDRNLAPPSAPSGLQPETDVLLAPAGAVPNSFGVITTGVPSGTGLVRTLSSAPPPPAEIPRVGGNIRVPQRLVYVPPIYPAIALAARVEGIVILEATLDETGAVRDVKVLKSVALLDAAAKDAVLQWRYSPTRLNGVPVPVVMTITVRFALRD